MRGSTTSRRTVAAIGVLIAAGSALTGCAKDDTGTEVSGFENKATGSPIVIGYTNTEGKGAISFPTYTTGVELAVARINSEGGIDGHPIELNRCLTDGTPDSSVNCANTFVDASVPVVLSGVDVGVDATAPVLSGAGVPTFGTSFQGQVAAGSPAFFQVGPPPSATISIPIDLLADQGSTSIAFVSAETPVVHQFFDSAVKPLAEEAGLDASLITYNFGSPDFASVVATLKAGKHDGVIALGGEEQCSGFATSAADLGYDGTVVLGLCSAFATELGSRAEGFYSLGMAYSPASRDEAPASKQAELDQYAADVEQAGLQDDVDLSSLYGYSSTITLVRVLDDIDGDITPASVHDALAALSDFDTFAGDVIDCAGRSKEQGAACDTKALVFQVKADGTQSIVGGGYTTPSN